ncbi:hypothetical protein ANCDUO_00476 [Ancylostoma duodenale]|uniref:Uncharacterized protein n=1 Tax=Ancylostoma duodenale TaxID=51022 RepID=A0A0C2E1F2_9BILA|nr:hypothetical protein ANCDUO_00476 [Ancylostoma duodenale]
MQHSDVIKSSLDFNFESVEYKTFPSSSKVRTRSNHYGGITSRMIRSDIDGPNKHHKLITDMTSSIMSS